MGGHGGAGTVAVAAAAAAKRISARKLLMQRKAQQVETEASASLLFHCSGVNCKQWRELKNSLASIQGKALFQPNYKHTSDHEKGQYASRIASSPGPLVMLYLGEGSSHNNLSKLLPPASLSDNMLLLYGQQRSNLLNHLDVKKAATLDQVGVYRRGFFSTLFNPMAFFSGLDRLKAAKDSESGEQADEPASKEASSG